MTRSHPPRTALAGYRALRLATPPVRRLAPDGVFDDFAWCASDAIDCRLPDAWRCEGSVTADNPAGMAFVLHAHCDFLPRELAHLHVGPLASEEEWALAPYAIDDATDALWARHVRPRDVLLLAASHLGALAWGLHDWAHFHNHGPFTERAWTELQCDATALAWLWRNRDAIGLTENAWEDTLRSFRKLSRERFRAEGLAFDERVLERGRVEELVT